MAGERIEDVRDARGLREDFKKPKRHTNDVTVQVGPKAEHGMTGVGMDGFEFDPAEMHRALDDLARHRDALVAYQKKAAELAHELPDGGGPVARQMRRAYLDRADPDNGVQAVLRDYIEELDQIQGAIMMTLQAYRNLDANAAAAITRPAGEEVE